jgi:chlorobactene glucosyltransferase
MPDTLTLLWLPILLTLGVLLLILAANLAVLPRLASHAPPEGDSAPRVAVLVPARDEAANIEACVRSLLSQRYEPYEVWVYDDGSTDATPEILARLAAEDTRLHIVTAQEEPPPGWLGKAHALWRLYANVRQKGTPDYLLFTDADVVWEPDALGRAVGAARGLDAGLLSVFPRQITLTWAERLAVPLFLHWAVYQFLPLPLAHTRRTGPAFAAANGQFMLFRRGAYDSFDGHEAVRGDVLEDVGLARATKRAGYSAYLADGDALVRTRMYNGPGEVWRGYSKNAYAFFGYTPLFGVIGVLVLAGLYVLPMPLALVGGLTGNQQMIWLALAQYALGVLPRLLLAFRFHYGVLGAFLHPVGVAYQIAILANSMVWAHTGRGAWKGRTPKLRPK